MRERRLILILSSLLMEEVDVFVTLKARCVALARRFDTITYLGQTLQRLLQHIV